MRWVSPIQKVALLKCGGESQEQVALSSSPFLGFHRIAMIFVSIDSDLLEFCTLLQCLAISSILMIAFLSSMALACFEMNHGLQVWGCRVWIARLWWNSGPPGFELLEESKNPEIEHQFMWIVWCLGVRNWVNCYENGHTRMQEEWVVVFY